MRGRSRASRAATVLATIALFVAGCSSDDDGGLPEGLRDISELDPVGADGHGSADDPEPDEVQPDEADTGEPEVDADGEPDSEPDDASEGDDGVVTVSGVVVPDSAFQINPDLDLDPDQQRELLQFSLDAYLYTTTALNTGEWDPDELAAYYANDALDGYIRGFERYDRDGWRQINDGTRVDLLRIESFSSAGVIIRQCITHGPGDGVVELSSGRVTVDLAGEDRSLELPLALVELEEGTIAYRIVGGGASPDVAC